MAWKQHLPRLWLSQGNRLPLPVAYAILWGIFFVAVLVWALVDLSRNTQKDQNGK